VDRIARYSSSMLETGPGEAPPARSAETFLNQAAELRRMSEWFRIFARGTALPSSRILDFELCLNELMQNWIQYGFPSETSRDGGAHRMHLELEYDGHWLQATAEDDGTPFDPRSASPRGAEEDLDSIRIGGWGIPIIRSFADELRYERLDGKNRTCIGMRAQ